VEPLHPVLKYVATAIDAVRSLRRELSSLLKKPSLKQSPLHPFSHTNVVGAVIGSVALNAVCDAALFRHRVKMLVSHKIRLMFDSVDFMKLKKILVNLVKLSGVVAIVVGADILIGGSVYHPLTYLYKLGSWNICRNSAFKNCTGQKDLSVHTSQGSEGSVVTSQARATEVGLDILKEGGNAIDAAVAVGYALAVTHPCCGNLGGGGFMLIRTQNGKTAFINFREKAPLAATESMYLDDEGEPIDKLSTEGFLATGTPGTVKGLEEALKLFGTMPRQKVIAPAIQLAEEGFLLTEGDIDILNEGRKLISQDAGAEQIFFGGEKRQAGDQLIQKDLAQTLRQIVLGGEKAFYQGEIAQKIVSGSKKNAGILSQKDFDSYNVSLSEPVQCTYRSYQIITAPPPGGGITLCQMLNILEGYPSDELQADSKEAIHKLLSSMVLSFADRNTLLGDPKFVKNPTARLLSKEYAKTLRATIPDRRAIPPQPLFSGITSEEGTNTTHYSIVDKFGNAVSVTYTINSYFGSGVIPKGTGFFLNNEMDDFAIKSGMPNKFGLVQGSQNKIEPGKQPLSSMAPVMVLKDSQLVFVTGSPGGSTIPTTLFQIIVNHVDRGMSLTEAVNAPRIHYQGLPRFVLSEPYGLRSQTFQELWEMGYRVVPFQSWGAAETIEVPSDRMKVGINDHRQPAGQALAY
jgi:gamma-glutamyltranspeptidase / glutathione hydrolase